MLTPQEDTGYNQDDLAVNAVRAQRNATLRPGDYLCQKCQTNFKFASGESELIQCPNCQNTKAESLTPFYTEEDPSRDEMLGKDEFSAGD